MEQRRRVLVLVPRRDDGMSGCSAATGVVPDRSPAHGHPPRRAAAQGHSADGGSPDGKEDADRETAERDEAEGEAADGNEASGQTAESEEAGGDVAEREDAPGVTADLAPVGIGPDGELVHRQAGEPQLRAPADAPRAAAQTSDLGFQPGHPSLEVVPSLHRVVSPPS